MSTRSARMSTRWSSCRLRGQPLAGRRWRPRNEVLARYRREHSHGARQHAEGARRVRHERARAGTKISAENAKVRRRPRELMLVHVSPCAPRTSSAARQHIVASWRRGSPHLHAAATTRARRELMMLRLRILNRDLPHATSAGSGVSTSMADPAACTTAAVVDNASAAAAAAAVARRWRQRHCCHRRRSAGLRAWHLSPPESPPSTELWYLRLQLRWAGHDRPTCAGEAPARPVGRCARGRGYVPTASVTSRAHRVHKVRY